LIFLPFHHKHDSPEDPINNFNGYFKGMCLNKDSMKETKVIATGIPSCAPYLIYVFSQYKYDPEKDILYVDNPKEFYSKPLEELRWETDIRFIAHEAIEEDDLRTLALTGTRFNPDCEIIREKSYFKRASFISPLRMWFKQAFLDNASYDTLQSLDRPWKCLFHRKSRFKKDLFIEPSFEHRTAMLLFQEMRRLQDETKWTVFSLKGHDLIRFFPCTDNRDRVILGILQWMKKQGAIELLNDNNDIAFGKDYGRAKNVIQLLERVSGEPQLRGNYVPSIPLYDLNTEQKEAFAYITSRPISVLEGGPGTGKTYVASWILNHYAKVLTVGFVGLLIRMVHMRNGNRRELAYTIHSLKHNSAIGKWLDNEVEVLIIDESSNVATSLFASLARLFSEKNNLKKIIFVGDFDQLHSVKPGDLLFDMRNYFGYFKLTLNMRASFDTFARAIELIRQNKPQEIVFDQKQHLFEMSYSDNVLEIILKRIARDHGRIHLLEFRIFTLTKQEADIINEKCFQIMKKEGILYHINVPKYFIRKNFELFEGCIISIKKNYNRAYQDPKDSKIKRDIVSNGEILMITCIQDLGNNNGYLLRCIDHYDPDIAIEKTLWVKAGPSARCGNSIDPWDIQRGHCGTTYSNQGREYEHCVFFVEPNPNFCRSSAYVAMSRSKKTMTLVYRRKEDFYNLVARKDPIRRTILGRIMPQMNLAKYPPQYPIERKNMILLNKEALALPLP
jgi:hypothetical protein